MMPAADGGHAPFACSAARPGDDIDHVVRRHFDPAGRSFPPSEEANPFVRYRALSSAHQLALARGLTDEQFVGIVRELDASVATVDGAGFRATPFAPAPALSRQLGCADDGMVWVKDETANVSGSHKARHLMGVMLYLQVLQRVTGTTDRSTLAIASCGNAALAAGVVARAAGWPLEVFVPPSADAAVVARLIALEAQIHLAHRRDGVAGDPCYLSFRESLSAGALPFCCQGSDNGLTIEGGETVAWEMISSLQQSPDINWQSQRRPIDAVFVQVGGGALASSLVQGFVDAYRLGAVTWLPRFYTVQTSGGYPLKRAYDGVAERILERVPLVVEQGFSPAADRERADLMAAHPSIIDEELQHARTHRSAFMRPWEKEPHSIAHGILDDETYDWAAVVEGMLRSGGWPLVVGEDRLLEANIAAHQGTGIDVDHTGSAGLAGLMKAIGIDTRLAGERVAVIFSGRTRS